MKSSHSCNSLSDAYFVLTNQDMIKIGLISEGKTPPDSRVALTPTQAKSIEDTGKYKIYVQPSATRCYTDEEYLSAGLSLSDDMPGCDFLLGIKEVPKNQLIPNKKYFFFSHTYKKQVYNQALLQKIIDDNITLYDYELLTDNRGQRVIAFGFFAGMVGAHNAMYTFAQRTELFEIKRLKDCFDYAEATKLYRLTKLPALKIVLTGTGRVGSGAAKVLQDMGIKKVSPEVFLTEESSEAIFTQLAPKDYAARIDDSTFEDQYFFDNPKDHKSTFVRYTKVADIMINGIYWDNDAPAFFTTEEMKSDLWRIKVIADITCDIAPVSSIPSTLFASTIADPIFGYDPQTGKESAPHKDGIVDMMTVDNLPNELPRDASQAFGEMFTDHVLDTLHEPSPKLLERAMLASEGQLGPHFKYLGEDYVKEKNV